MVILRVNQGSFQTLYNGSIKQNYVVSLMELVNLIGLREVSVNGMVNLGVDEEGWKTLSGREYKRMVDI